MVHPLPSPLKSHFQSGICKIQEISNCLLLKAEQTPGWQCTGGPWICPYFHLGHSTPLHPGAPIIPCLLPIKRKIPYFLSNESSEEWNESFPFKWIIIRRRVVQLPLWGSSIQQRSRSIVSTTPACACALHLCAHTFEGQGSQAAHCYTVILWLLSLDMGNAVGTGMTQLSSSFCWKHFENIKKKKIVGADLRSDLCPSTSLTSF